MERPITIAMLALGGQGGGVLTKWLVDIAEANAWLAQSTYVAGVAQRTGATIYCVEMMSRSAAEAAGSAPVFAQYPVPGDVDVCIASELAETGRAIEKGFVTPNATTLIASSHRDYSITEKSALGDGIVDLEPVIDAGRKLSRQFVCFDMNAKAKETSSVISAVILGAIAGSGVLPFERRSFEQAIRASGRAVETNLAGFAAGFEGAVQSLASGVQLHGDDGQLPEAEPQGPQGRELSERIGREFAPECATLASHGALRALSYQDTAYADLYLERLAGVQALDRSASGERRHFKLTNTVARELALQMCYEDTIRVAEVKVRAERLDDIGEDIGAAAGQPYYVTEYFHPRFEEFCDTLPAPLARRALGSDRLRRLTRPLFSRGRNVSTNKIGGFVFMSMLAKLRRWRRGTYRFGEQQEHIETWLAAVRKLLPDDYDAAVAVAESIEIVRGYGETYERGLSRYRATLDAAQRVDPSRRAQVVRNLHSAALADEQGKEFDRVLAEIGA